MFLLLHWRQVAQSEPILTWLPLSHVYTGPDKFLHGQKLARFHLAFTRDRWNWTDFWMAKCASLGPAFFAVTHDMLTRDCPWHDYWSLGNWFTLSVRISSYGCTREVWRAQRSVSRDNREQLWLLEFTVIPVKPWAPGKISRMFIVSRPIRSEMKPQKITAKPQHGLVTTWFETTSWFFFHNKSSVLPFSNRLKLFFLYFSLFMCKE